MQLMVNEQTSLVRDCIAFLVFWLILKNKTNRATHQHHQIHQTLLYRHGADKQRPWHDEKPGPALRAQLAGVSRHYR